MLEHLIDFCRCQARHAQLKDHRMAYRLWDTCYWAARYLRAVR